MGHALVPGAGDTELFGAGCGVVVVDGMELFRGGFGSVEDGWDERFVFGFGNVFDPDLVDVVVLPVGEEAHAVTAAHDCFKVVLELVHGKVLVDDLGHIEARLDVERDLGDDSQ